ncbi:hypothetical protein [Micromonospora zamorensis]|uniref:hypothetical protein n=1 Tax=Micromonospora zamorensis TaxID=709883 RepID=UPI0012FD1876|nr:hypothetical protein [Micromonospora zamorensis]
MAFRTWGRLLLTALGVSVLAGAGQLGVAYGFGIVRLTGAFTGTTVNQWPTQLVWVGWFAANAAVVGAVLTGRLARRDAPAVSTGRQLAIGGAAALGATVIAPLCMQPARAAELISVDPVWAVGICAVLGAVIGAGAAIAVLLRPELGWNMAAVAGAVWLLALISVLPSLGTTGPMPTVRLGVLEPSWLADDAAQRLSLLLLPIVALLAGVATAALARWRGQAPLISGATGVAGPVLVAFAYLTAGPGDAVDRYQATPYYGSLIAILAGALGAAAAALLRWPTGARSADSQAIEPSDILRPLPPGPALPGTASANSTNDPDTTERTDAELPADTKPAGGVVAGPRAAAGSDGVRTAPAHWDWPASTTGGQDGPTPAVAAKPAAWLTDPTGEFTAGAQTRRSIPDDVTSPVESERSAATSVSSPTDATPASAKAGRADAATPTVGHASAPTDSATNTLTTATGAPGAGTASTGTTSTGMASAGTTATEAASKGAASPGAASTGTTSASAADAGTGDAAVPSKPRRVRKPKVSPGAAISDPVDDAAPSESDTADEAATGRTRKVTRAGRSADSTGSGTVTAAPVPSEQSPGTDADPTTETALTTTSGATAVVPTTSGATAAAPTAASGSTATPAGAKAEAVKPPRTRAATAGTEAADPTAAAAAQSSRVPAEAPVPKAEAPRPKAEAADPKVEATKPPRAPAASSAVAGAADLPRSEAAATSSKADAANPPRTPTTATSPKAKTADPASASATQLAGEADDEPAATEDGPGTGLFGSTAAGDPDADRWTPAPSAWPVSAAWTVPPQTSAPGPATSETPTGSDKATGPTPRPRHRAPLPDLSRASSWNAFDTTRRAGQAEAADSSADRTTPTSAAATGETAAHLESPSRPDAPVVPGAAGTSSDAGTGTDAGTDETASTDATPAASKPGKVAEQPSRRGRLGGLFRRNRSRADEESQQAADNVEPLPAKDEEFVDWVAGLSKPVSDNEPEQDNGRRSLRSTGRHHRE